MASGKRIALSILLVSAFIFLTFIMIFTYSLPPKGSFLEPIFGALVTHHLEIMVLIGTFGVAVGAAVYYLMSDQIEKKGVQGKAVKEVLLRFLSRDDKAVVNELLNHKGRIYQAELAHLPNMTRLKAHRIVAKLEHMGVVEVKPMGKMRSIELKEELKGVLLE
jgi:GTP-sensing pleiotropic transcriptional regulator CodY